jgi:hypothetical protein
MTEALLEHLDRTEHPSVEYWFGRLNAALKKNTVAFQAAFGVLSFGSLTGFVYSVSTSPPEKSDFLWLAMWGIVFGVFVVTIQLEHWKEREELRYEQRKKDIDAKDRFNTRFIDWLYTRAEGKSDDEALNLFERGMVVFGSIPTDTVNKQLTQMMMMMNDIIFHSQPSTETKTSSVSPPPPVTSDMTEEEKLDIIRNGANS